MDDGDVVAFLVKMAEVEESDNEYIGIMVSLIFQIRILKTQPLRYFYFYSIKKKKHG